MKTMFLVLVGALVVSAVADSWMHTEFGQCFVRNTCAEKDGTACLGAVASDGENVNVVVHAVTPASKPH